jgi:hypothetical protein
MSERELYFLNIYGGYLLFASRLVLLIVLFWKYLLVKNKNIIYLLLFSVIGTAVALFEIVFIYLANNQNPLVLKLLTTFKTDSTYFTSPIIYVNEIFFYSALFSNLFANKKIFYWGIFLVVLEIINSIFFEDIRQPQQFGIMALTLNSLILSLFYIRHLFINKLEKKLNRNPYLIISLSIAIPLLFSILYYFLTKKMFEQDTKIYYQLSLFRYAIESLGYLGMAFGVWQIRRNFRQIR